MKIHKTRTTALAGVVASLGLAVTGCGGGSGSSTSGAASSAPAASSAMSSPMATESSMSSSSSMPSDTSSGMSSGSASGTASGSAMTGKEFGPACSAVPKSGDGSFEGMAQAPVATAASANPVLSTLVTAVKQAKLVDTLNGAQDITVFAPTNDAFKKVPKATLMKAMKDPNGLLKTVLTYHVVAGRLSPDQLAGSHKTLQGGTVKVTGSGQSFTVDGKAKVVCGNVQTANATVYIIDSVLLPKS